MSHGIPSLSEAFGQVDGLFVNAEYREIPGYRFRHDAKVHNHAALAGQINKSERVFDLRHWTIQDVYDSAHLNETLKRAAQYGMTGIQFSGDNIYWVNDALHRYNAYVFVGELCERCHDLGLKAYFWVHEINGFFHEFVTNGTYGFSGQLAGGTIDLSSRSKIWDILYEKYDVFFRRLRGVDGIVLTLNECQVPVFRDDCIVSDLDAAHRVAKIGQTVKAACDAHGRHLILRTFCYSPDETERVRDGVRLIGPDVTVMIKCVPHDWQTFYPHDPLIAALKEFPKVIEFDLAHEPMGAGRFPYPDTEHLKHRFDHITAHGAIGVAGRIDRFRNHAAGTLNWSNVYSFSRLAQQPSTQAGALLSEYANADFGSEAMAFMVDAMNRLYAAGQQTFFLGREWGSHHSNLNTFSSLGQNPRWNRAAWNPADKEARETFQRLSVPTPSFIERIAAEKAASLADLRKMASELEVQPAFLKAQDRDYLATALARSIVLCDALTTQHVVMLMVRHDAPRAESERLYKIAIAERLSHLRTMAAGQVVLLRDAGNEGCQYGPEVLEHFCRNAERHLQAACVP
jgi:hypothetical protein